MSSSGIFKLTRFSMLVLTLLTVGGMAGTARATDHHYITHAPPILPDSLQSYGMDLQWTVVNGSGWVPLTWQVDDSVRTISGTLIGGGSIVFNGSIEAPLNRPGGS